MTPMETAWQHHIWQALRQPAGKNIRIEKRGLPPPAASGFYRSTGLPKGQLLDYRWAMPNGRGIHLQDFGTHYGMHWDRVDPSVSIKGHLMQDAPIALKVGGLLAGGLALWLASRGKKGS